LGALGGDGIALLDYLLTMTGYKDKDEMLMLAKS
jgi:hypothetical protein